LKNRRPALDTRVVSNRLATRAAIIACAILFAAACSTEVNTQNPPPYASISSDASEPSSAPKPPREADATPPQPQGAVGTTTDALSSVILLPFRLIGSAFK
jgi:hypothetical protein